MRTGQTESGPIKGDLGVLILADLSRGAELSAETAHLITLMSPEKGAVPVIAYRIKIQLNCRRGVEQYFSSVISRRDGSNYYCRRRQSKQCRSDQVYGISLL
jgi:hypothetical protein